MIRESRTVIKPIPVRLDNKKVTCEWGMRLLQTDPRCPRCGLKRLLSPKRVAKLLPAARERDPKGGGNPRRQQRKGKPEIMGIKEQLVPHTGAKDAKKKLELVHEIRKFVQTNAACIDNLTI